MALASAARSEPGCWPPSASAISSCARSGMAPDLPGNEGEVFGETGQLEEPHDPGFARDQLEVEAVAVGLVVEARDERDAGRGHEVEPAQVDHDARRAAFDRAADRVTQDCRGSHVEIAARAQMDRAVLLGDLTIERFELKIVGQGNPRVVHN